MGKRGINMRHIVGGFFKLLGVIAFVIFGLWGFIIELAIVSYVAGFWGVVFGFIILPITFTITPWYALVAWGNWFPLLIVYGGWISATILYGTGSIISGD